MANQFSKHPSETYPVGIDYTGKAPAGAILLSTVWSAMDMFDDTDASGDVLSNTTGIISGAVAKVRVEGGVPDHAYRLSLQATFDTGDILHDNIYMTVDEEG